MPISNALGWEFIPGPDPPADTTPPTVDITSHSNGAIISGGFTVKANDNVGVTRVSFGLGTINLGYKNNAPYEKSYDIMNAGFSLKDGNYLLTAIAFDAAGNYAVDGVTVQVVNGRMLMAVIVGISDYKSETVENLFYCDEDATDWYNHL
ncbi:MAG: Ig-like domain-containing protein [Candidatus Heimdallarchaeota archaeon]